jgi:hypothetical protein
MRHYDKIPAVSRPRYVSYAVVMGEGEFPYDMLRYDNCRPWKELDSGSMRYDAMTGPKGERWVVLERLHVDTNPRWTGDRWKSFGWTLVESTPEEAHSYHRERDRLAEPERKAHEAIEARKGWA